MHSECVRDIIDAQEVEEELEEEDGGGGGAAGNGGDPGLEDGGTGGDSHQTTNDTVAGSNQVQDLTLGQSKVQAEVG